MVFLIRGAIFCAEQVHISFPDNTPGRCAWQRNFGNDMMIPTRYHTMIQIPPTWLANTMPLLIGEGWKPGTPVLCQVVAVLLWFLSKVQFRPDREREPAGFQPGKLKKKRRVDNLINQAGHAIFLFQEMENLSENKRQQIIHRNKGWSFFKKKTAPLYTINNASNQVVCPAKTAAPRTREHLPRPYKSSQRPGADRTGNFIELKNAITVRHYSPKTLKSYSGWTRKFQYYTKSKEANFIFVDDV